MTTPDLPNLPDFFQSWAGFDEEPNRMSSAATRRWATRKGYDPEKPETYDIDHVYTRATNKHDHSSRLNVHVPRDQQIFLMRLVNDEATPYETIADLCRDALIHRAKYWEDKIADPNYVPDFNIFALKNEQEAFRMEYEAQKAAVEEAAKMLNELAGDRAWHMLAHQIMVYRATVTDLGSPWQERMCEALDMAESRLPNDDTIG